MIHNIYRQEWQKVNGWRVRVDFLPSGGDDFKYMYRTVEIIRDVYQDASDNQVGFDDIYAGLCDASTCKFVLNCSNAPSTMQAALAASATFDSTPQVSLRARPNLFVIWSDRGTNGGTWTVQYIGAQKLTPETVYTVAENDDLIVKVETMCVQILAGETLMQMDDIRGYFNSALLSELNGTGSSLVVDNRRNGAIIQGFRANSTQNYFMNYNATTTQVCFSTFSNFFASAQVQFNRVMSFYLMQPDGNYSNYAGFISAIPYRFYKQAIATNNIGNIGDEIPFADLWIMLGEHNFTLNSSGELQGRWLSGFLSDNDNETLTSKSKNYWELLRQISETFYLKTTLNYGVVSDALFAGFRFQHPTQSAFAAQSITYKSTLSNQAEFERNKHIIAKSKYHQVAGKGEVENTEFFTNSLASAGFEVNGLFNIDAPSNVFVSSLLGGVTLTTSFLNTRGLFYRINTDRSNKVGFVTVSPRVGFRRNFSGGFFIDDPSNFEMPAFTVGSTSAGLMGTKNTISIDFIARLKEIQKLRVGLKNSAGQILTQYGQNSGQTAYNMTLPLEEWLTPERLGNRVDVTPHPSVASYLRTSCFITELNINWSAKDDADYVTVTLLTGEL